MASGWVVPLLAGGIAVVFAARVWGEWSVRRKWHQFAWATGLTLYALATFVDAYVAARGGWTVPGYRLFFALASGNVGFLGLGTVLLTRSTWAARLFAVFVVAAFATASLAQFAVPLTEDTFVGECAEDGPVACERLGDAGSELGAKAIPWSSPARWAFLALNVVGGLALIVGAVVSWWQTRRLGVLLIGVGAMMPFLGGSLSTLLDVDLRVLGQFVGIVIMFVGYLRGRDAIPPREAGRPADG